MSQRHKLNMFKCLIICLLFCFTSCGNSKNDNIIILETPLERVFEYLDVIWTEEQKTYFKNQPDSALIDYHKSVGMWIRNTWLRGECRDAELADYMIDFGLKNPDDISHVIYEDISHEVKWQRIRLK